MSDWFEDLHYGWKVAGIVSSVMGSAALCAWLAGPIPEDSLRQYEVTLGDGTKATCIIVRDAGVTCIPHVVVGEDDAAGDEVKP
jgi:hypothetical protein